MSTRWLAWVPALSTQSACRRHPLSRTRPTLRPRVSLPTWSLSWRCAYLNPLVAAVSLALPACTFLFFSFLFSAFSLETRRGLRCSRRVSPPLCLFVPPLLSSACGGPHWCAAACVPCRTRRRVAAAAAASGRQGFPVLRCAALLRPALPLPGPIPPPPSPAAAHDWESGPWRRLVVPRVASPAVLCRQRAGSCCPVPSRLGARVASPPIGTCFI